MRPLPALGTLCLLVLLLPARAIAAEEGPPQPTRRPRLLVEPALGIGAPTGFTGGSGILRPIERLSFAVGGGLGAGGPQIASGGRVHFPEHGNVGLSFGLGWSTGALTGRTLTLNPFAAMSHRTDNRTTPRWERAHLLNVDVSAEAWVAPGMAVRSFVGLYAPLNRPDEGAAGQSANPFVGVGFLVGLL
jgi:hypothetical protein